MRLRLMPLFVTLFVCATAAGPQTILKFDETAIPATVAADHIGVELTLKVI